MYFNLLISFFRELNYNLLTGSIPANIGNMEALQRMYARRRRREERSERERKGEKKGEREGKEREIILNCSILYDNELDGPLPASLGNLKNLVEM